QFEAPLVIWAIKTLLVQVPESELYYPAGVELTLSLNERMIWNAALPSEQTATSGAWKLVQRLTTDERQELARLMPEIPDRTRHPSSRPSDLINILFNGSREQLEAE